MNSLDFDIYSANSAPAIVISQLFTGHIPTEARLTQNAAFVANQEASAAAGTDKDMLGYQALGKEYAHENPGATSISTDAALFFTSLYQTVFGRAGSPAQIQQFVDQEAYFKSLYTSVGFADAAVQARGAAEGLLLGEAVKEGGNFYSNGVGQVLSDAASKTIVFGLPLDQYKADTVPGPVVTVPGPTVVTIVDAPDQTTRTWGSLEAKYVNANNGLLFGDGTTPNTGLNIVHDPVSGFGVDVANGPRQANNGEKFIPLSTAFDGKTFTVNYLNPAGPQDMSNGSFANNANRGAANTVTVFTHDTDLKAMLVAGNKLVQAWDSDPTAGVNQIKFESFIANDGTIDFKQIGGAALITDSGMNQFAVANSQQQNFFVPGGVAALVQGAQFQNEFYVQDANGVKLVGLIENITLGAPGYSPADQLT